MSNLQVTIENLQLVRNFASVWMFGGGLIAALAGFFFGWRTKRPSRQKHFYGAAIFFTIIAMIIVVRFILLLEAANADGQGLFLHSFFALMPLCFGVLVYLISYRVSRGHHLDNSKSNLIVNGKPFP